LSVRAWPGRDCVARVRVHYLLPRPLVVRDHEALPDAKVTVTEFSLFTNGARDHLRFTVGPLVDASGVLGENELVVTYGKVTGERPATLISAIEARLAAHFGPIAHFASRAEAFTEAS
jgi:hypothetical protein